MQLSDLLQLAPPRNPVAGAPTPAPIACSPPVFGQARSAAGVMPARSWRVHSPYLRKDFRKESQP